MHINLCVKHFPVLFLYIGWAIIDTATRPMSMYLLMFSTMVF